jgi:OOP family OmpA-OmpF porin
MLKRTIVSFVAMAALSAPAFGAQFGKPGESGFYGGAGLGRTQSDVNAPGISGDDEDTAWKLFGGYQINRYLGLELGYHDLGRASATGPGGSATFDSTAWTGSVVGSLPITQRFAGFAKVGLARTETDAVGTIGGAPSVTNDRNTDATYGLGLRYDFTKAVGVRGEWERFRSGGGLGGGKNDIDVFSVSGVVRFW